MFFNKGDLFIAQRPNALPDLLLVVHYCTPTGIHFHMWSEGIGPGQGSFIKLEEVPWADFESRCNKGLIQKFQLL